MNARSSGAALRGGMGMAPPMAAPAGATGAALAGMAPAPAQGEPDDISSAIQAVIQAAQSAGFQLPAGEVPPEQLPQVYAQILAAAAQSEMGQSPEGQQLIAQLAQVLGVPSPFAQAAGTPEAMPPDQGMMPPSGGMPPGGMRY